MADPKRGHWFEIDRPSPYMLLVADIVQEKRIALSHDTTEGLEQRHLSRSEVPAITHIDYSARIHTVSAKHNPLFYRLIEKFHQRTSCPMLINTSFNVRGEPIVCTPADAYRCFTHTNMDYLIMGKNIINRNDQNLFTAKVTTRGKIELD